MSTINDYKIREADKHHDISAINILLESYFHPEETLLKCMLDKRQLNNAQLQEIDIDQRRIIEAMIVNFPCLVAVHKVSNRIVGVNITISNEDHQLYETHAPKSTLLVDYFRRMNAMIDEAELSIVYPNSKRALEFYAVAVDKEHRRQGLATMLMKEGLQVAKRNGMDLVFGLFTSPYSKRSAEKIGMKSVVEIDLLKYRDEDGSQVFLESVPHNVASVMAIILE